MVVGESGILQCLACLTSLDTYAGCNMSIIQKVDKHRLLSIEFDTNQSTNISEIDKN